MDENLRAIILCRRHKYGMKVTQMVFIGLPALEGLSPLFTSIWAESTLRIVVVDDTMFKQRPRGSVVNTTNIAFSSFCDGFRIRVFVGLFAASLVHTAIAT
ncbi:Uu.00g110670.m01.CDS01 [Anthostomella pinea]|uniref:Uu.00g110670.m01.CDS01 n=1 Tax=Anthostomella pinea TaxID=933095 RepID=A0AAI8YGA0_9PEZI|nr:Uu.00g110670.m01.CDS01 [Anthostomella pinea]